MTELDWQPTATIDVLKRRAQLMADIRRFFTSRNILEVETPVLSQSAPTAPYLKSFQTVFSPDGGQSQDYYLQTSPEFAMKRLLAAGSGDIFQIAKVFRNGEKGRIHSPEFTMLEWYRPQLNYHQLMEETDLFLQTVAGLPAAQYFTYQQIFEDFLSIGPHECDSESLAQVAYSNITGLPRDWAADRDGWLEMLMSQCIEPQLVKLKCPVIVYDFPASQSQLAKTYQNSEGQIVAARFEVYAEGLELANGYDECVDAGELATRFAKDNQQRGEELKPTMPVDQRLLAAIESGFPECTGVALGIDRLMLLITGKVKLNEVKSFDFSNS